MILDAGLTKAQSSFYKPYTSPHYGDGDIMGVENMLTQYPQFVAQLDASWQLIPQALRIHTAAGKLGTSGKTNRGRVNPLMPVATSHGFTFTLTTGNYGGVYLAPDSTWLGNLFTIVNTPDSYRRGYGPGYTPLADPTPVSTTLVHEFGHMIDFTWLRYLPIGTEWNETYFRADTLKSAAAGSGKNYGWTNRQEWFAELFTVRVMCALKPGETYAWDSSSGQRYSPSQILYLAGGSKALEARILDLFERTFPGLFGALSPYEQGFTGIAPPNEPSTANIVTRLDAYTFQEGAYAGIILNNWGTRTYADDITVTGLPAGLEWVSSLSYLFIRGTPTLAGTYPIVISYVGPNGQASNLNYNLVVAPEG